MTAAVSRTARRVTDVCVEVMPPAGYLTPEWYAARADGVSASEVAVILGLSPYDSAFNLWWAKYHGEGRADDETDETRRGRRLEPLVLDDFAEAHPELTLTRCGLLQSTRDPWMLATPDALAYETGGRSVTSTTYAGIDPLGPVEAKTAGGSEGWGERGTDQVPVHYRCQGLWQMAVLGLTTQVWFPVWVGYDFREYVIDYDAEADADVDFMIEAAAAFLDSIADGTPPEVDAHTETRHRLKQLHPSLTDRAVEVPDVLVRQFNTARRLRDLAEERRLLAENRLRALMGDAKRAVVDGRKVASRSVSDMPGRVQTVAAHTRDTLNVSKSEPTQPRRRIRP